MGHMGHMEAQRSLAFRALSSSVAVESLVFKFCSPDVQIQHVASRGVRVRTGYDQQKSRLKIMY
jgi:hypothetical protein